MKKNIAFGLLSISLILFPNTFAEKLTKKELPPNHPYSLEEDLQKTNIFLLDSLPPFNSYVGQKGIKVYQAEARFLEPKDDVGGLYTSGALSCAILIGVARENQTSKLVRIGMTHIDRAISYDYVLNFYARLNINPNNSIEAYVISGIKENALKVLKASRVAGVNIKFFNADLDGERGDNVIVDRNGQVFYGSYFDLLSSPIISDTHEYGVDSEIRKMRLSNGWEKLVYRN